MQDLLMVLGIAFVPVSVMLMVLWLSAKHRAEKAESVVHDLVIAPRMRGESLGAADTHLSRSLDSLAFEVERIAESQRFTLKLLSERREGGSSVIPYRVNTPH